MSVGTQSLIINLLLGLVVPILATIRATALLCCYRIARKKRVSYGTMFAGASIVPFLLAVVVTCLQPDVWWSRAHESSPAEFLATLGFLLTMCALPALFVVVHYKRRSKRDETPVAA